MCCEIRSNDGSAVGTDLGSAVDKMAVRSKRQMIPFELISLFVSQYVTKASSGDA